jgi:hypothetical protein
MHSTLSHIPCFIISLVLLGVLMAMLTGFAVTYPTGSLGSVFLEFILHLLKFSPLFLRDLFWDPCSCMCLLMAYVMQLPTLSIYVLLTISKSTEPLSLLKAAVYYGQTLINSVQGWCTANYRILNISKTKVISFSRKTNVLIYDYKLCQSSIKDLGIFLDSKLHFHNHVNHIFSRCIKLLGPVRTITFTFSSLEFMLRLCVALIRSKLEYASAVWNSITSTDADKLESIQQRFAALCFNRFFPQVHYSHSLALEELKLHALCMRRHHLDALFLTQVYLTSKFCSCVLEIAGLRVPALYISDFALFNVCS